MFQPAAKPIKPTTKTTSSAPSVTSSVTVTFASAATPTPATNATSIISDNTCGLKISEVVSLAKEPAVPVEIEVTGAIPRTETFSCKFCPAVYKELMEILDHVDLAHEKEYLLACPFCPFSCSKMLNNLVRHIKRTHPERNPDAVKIVDEGKYFTRITPKRLPVNSTSIVELDSSGEDEIYYLKGKRTKKGKSQEGSDKSSTHSEEDSVMVQKTAPTVINVGPPADDMPLDMSVPSKPSKPSSEDMTILRQPPPMQPAPKLTRNVPIAMSPSAFQAQRLQPPPLIPLGVIDGTVKNRLQTPQLVRAPTASATTPITIEPPPAHSHPPAKPSPTYNASSLKPKPPVTKSIQQQHQEKLKAQQHAEQLKTQQLKALRKAKEEQAHQQKIEQLKAQQQKIAAKPPARPSSPADDDPGAIQAFSVFNLGPRMRARQQPFSRGVPALAPRPNPIKAPQPRHMPPPRPPPVYPRPDPPKPSQKIHQPSPRHAPPPPPQPAPIYPSFMMAADPHIAQQLVRLSQQAQQARSMPAPPPLSSPALIAPRHAPGLPSTLGGGPPNVVVRPGMGFTPGVPPPRAPLERVYSCPYCPCTAPDQDTLHNHILTHEPNIQWTCPYCQMPNQMSKGFVEKHIKNCHPGKRVVYIPFGIQL